MSVTISSPLNTSAIQGVAYDSTPVEIDGTGPFVWSIFSGSLPPGLTLIDPATGQTTGTPTTLGTFTFRLRVDDSFGFNIVNTAIVVSAVAPAVTVPTPVEIDLVNQRLDLIGIQSNVGSIAFSGALYLPGVEYDVNLNSYKVVIYKSLDNGLTWTPVDRLNGPVVQDAYAFYPTTGGATIFTAYNIPGATKGHRLQPFDLASETWGAASSDGITAQFSSSIAPVLTVLSDGTTQVIAWSTRGGPFPPGHYEIHVMQYAAGTWGSEITVDATSSSGTYSGPTIVVDAADTVWIFWTFLLGTSGNGLKCAPFASGAIGAVSTISASNTKPGNAIYLAGPDEIWLSATFDPTSGNNVGLFRGTPSSAPIWTNSNPGSVNPSLYALFLPLLARKSDTDIFLVWNATIDNSIGERQIQYIETTDGGTTWGAVQELWDTITQPLNPPSTLPGDAELQIQVGYNGTVLDMTVALFQILPVIGGLCGTIYYLSQGAALPLSLACPIGGTTATVGVFYDQFLQVSGGTPPYFFEII